MSVLELRSLFHEKMNCMVQGGSSWMLGCWVEFWGLWRSGTLSAWAGSSSGSGGSHFISAACLLLVFWQRSRCCKHFKQAVELFVTISVLLEWESANLLLRESLFMLWGWTGCYASEVKTQSKSFSFFFFFVLCSPFLCWIILVGAQLSSNLSFGPCFVLSSLGKQSTVHDFPRLCYPVFSFSVLHENSCSGVYNKKQFYLW